ncbi:MAG: hypothetical protein ABJG78_14870 [Cyclobacteriaceae bacterium]
MSQIRIIHIVAIVVCQQLAYAQTIPEPVLDGRAVYIQEDGNGIFLEQQRAEQYGGHSNLKGFSSSIRLDGDRFHEFIVRVDYSGNANEHIRIFRLKHKSHHTHAKDHRYIHLPHHEVERIETIGFDYVSFGESSLRITLKNKLTPGEYAITYGPNIHDVFNLFGVD